MKIDNLSTMVAQANLSYKKIRIDVLEDQKVVK